MNFENTDYRLEELDLENPFDVKLVTDFLSENGFTFKRKVVEYTMILYNLNDEIIGTGSFKKQTMKFVVVASKFREGTAFPLIVTKLSSIILENHKRCFVFTAPETAVLFEGLGFKEIARAEPLFVVLEFGFKLIDSFQKYLKQNMVETKTNNIASMVVNCNPFTLGHLFLIEKAASESEILYLFVVEEDKSSFPYSVRRKLIEEGTSHIKNIVILATGPYIVSGAIFPNYFIKKKSWSEISQKQAEVDVKVFANYVVPVLGITKRYIGSENYCTTTKAYNEAMKEFLPEANCEVLEIERKSIGKDDNDKPNYISASKVRQAIREDKMADIINYVPKVTRDFLMSDEAKSIIQNIKNTDTRH